MDLKLIIIVVSAVILNSFLMFFLFGYHLKKKDKDNSQIKNENSDFHKERKRFKLLILIGSIILSLAIVYFFNFKNSEKIEFLAPGTSVNSPSGDFYRNPEKIYPRGLNLIFFADNYPSWEEFENDVDRLMIGLRQIEPWKSYGDYNIYKINPGMETQLCQIKTENERKPVLRCNESINDYLEKIQRNNFRLVVLSRQDFQSWANVARLENSGIFFSLKDKLDDSNSFATGYLLAHLLGHAFGLKDEEKYVIAKADGAPHTPDGPNCAPDKETAQKWWGDLAQLYPERVGYFQTCAGSENYIRPTQSSLMNFGELENFIPDYGPVSERYLRALLKYCFSEERGDPQADAQFFEMYPEFKACLAE